MGIWGKVVLKLQNFLWTNNKTVINLSGYLTTNKVNIEAKQYYKGTSMDLPK